MVVAVCRDVANRSRVKDDHNFRWGEEQLAREGSARLQVLSCVHGEVLLVGVQSWGFNEGVSLVNDAERFAMTATMTFHSDQATGLTLPDLYIIVRDDSKGEVTTRVAVFSVSGSGVVSADFGFGALWDDIVKAHAEFDRGSGFIPRPVPAETHADVWVLANVWDAPEPRPFRQPCLEAHRPWWVSVRLRLRRGKDTCCWYHEVDWTTAVQLAWRDLDGADDGLPPARPQPGDRQVEQEGASCLSTDPITLSADQITNGQHRLRAMRDQRIDPPDVVVRRSIAIDDLAEALAKGGIAVAAPDAM